MASIIILGPAHPLRGGIAAFNERLARELQEMGHQVIIYSFSLQYPSFLFPGKTQYTDSPPPVNLHIRATVNTVNPFNWLRIGREIKRRRPDLVITRFWIPFMAPSLGSILRQIRKNKHTRVVCIADNVTPHEKRPGDQALTAYFLKACDAFIVMSSTVLESLKKLTQKSVQLIPHPIYDHFGVPIDQDTARQHLKLEPGKVILFFGFIRHYKGLDLLLEAMNDPEIRRENIHLLIAGEYYENEALYLQLIQKYALQKSVILHTGFISDDQVKYYFCSADVVALPYRSATQSGIAPMAYHFEKPMIATRVGGLPEAIPDGKSGLICEPTPTDLVKAILQFFQTGEAAFLPYLREQKNKYSWRSMAESILQAGRRKEA